MKLRELKERVCSANIELQTSNLVIHTWGNVSGIDREQNLVVIKPSGVPYEKLKPSDMVVVDFNNKIVEGDLKPSSDTKTHIVLYQNFPEIGGVVHTHSTYATSWAQAIKSIPCYGTTHADYSPGEIPCTEVITDNQIEGDYELETGKMIINTFKNGGFSSKYTPMVIVASHGPFTWGDTPEKAVYNAIVLEEVAKMAFNTININTDISPVKKSLIDKHFQRKHGKNAYYGQEEAKK
ncbi:MAG: L-ribulose-5-phosphate 4-epimerase [archaeon]|nr:L-ribulose-5-phosphate 4-epimerase [archaeon]